MKLGRWRNYIKVQAAFRHYTNQLVRLLGAFSVIANLRVDLRLKLKQRGGHQHTQSGEWSTGTMQHVDTANTAHTPPSPAQPSPAQPSRPRIMQEFVEIVAAARHLVTSCTAALLSGAMIRLQRKI